MQLRLALFGREVLRLDTGDPEPDRRDMRGSVTTEAMEADAPEHPALGFAPPSTRGIGWED